RTAAVTVGSSSVSVDDTGAFSAVVALVDGSNVIEVTATDANGNTARTSITVVRDSAAPSISLVRSSAGILTNKDLTCISGTVTNGRYSASVTLSFGSNVIFVEATDAAGNRATTSTAVSYVPQGVTTASVGLVLLPVLTVIALLVGLAIGQARRGRGGGGGGGGGPKLEEMSKEAASAEDELPPPEGEL